MDIKCECGGVLRAVTVRQFDFSAFAGIPVILQDAPGYRCSECNLETLDGEVINAILHTLACELAKLPRRLPGEHARFLRKHMHLTQKALAERMGIARETIAKWETGETAVSPQHDMMLRSIAASYLARSSRMPLTLADMANVFDHVRVEEPTKTQQPFIMDHVLAHILGQLRAEQTANC